MICSCPKRMNEVTKILERCNTDIACPTHGQRTAPALAADPRLVEPRHLKVAMASLAFHLAMGKTTVAKSPFDAEREAAFCAIREALIASGEKF